MFLRTVALMRIGLAKLQLASTSILDPKKTSSLYRGTNVWQFNAVPTPGDFYNHFYLCDYYGTEGQDAISGLLAEKIQIGDSLKVFFIEGTDVSGVIPTNPGWLYRIEVSRNGAEFQEVFSLPLEDLIVFNE
jgi:hypothetical protein